MREQWKQDILDEQKQLVARIESMGEYALTSEFEDLHENEQLRIHNQTHYMKKYQKVLLERITAWRYPEVAIKQ